jgi:16S rRNA (guanine966-N2)-methyltransferase
MRIVGGTLRGRALASPKHEGLRPTSDRVREAVFNILTHGLPDLSLEGAKVLDVFAGTGALGLEALSRGAREVVFVDVEPAVVRHIGDTLRELACDRGRTVRADAAGYLAQPATPFDVIFLDPPFSAPVLPDICQRLQSGGWLKEGGLVYIESPSAAGEPVLPPGWTLLKSRRAGEVGYHLARRDVGDRS